MWPVISACIPNVIQDVNPRLPDSLLTHIHEFFFSPQLAVSPMLCAFCAHGFPFARTAGVCLQHPVCDHPAGRAGGRGGCAAVARAACAGVAASLEGEATVGPLACELALAARVAGLPPAPGTRLSATFFGAAFSAAGTPTRRHQLRADPWETAPWRWRRRYHRFLWLLTVIWLLTALPLRCAALCGGCVAASQAPSSAEVRQHTQALFVAA